MSGVRVLVGTKKGAFVLTSDGKRERWDVCGPHFAGWEIYHLKGSPGRSEPHLRLAVERLVRTGDPALERRRQELGAGGQQVRVRRRARHPPVVRRHAAPLGVRARLAPRAVARPIPTRSTPASRTPRSSARPTAGQNWQELPGLREHGLGPPLAAGRRRACACTRSSLDPLRPRADLHRHLGGRRVPHRRRRQDLAADQPRPALGADPGPDRRGRPLRPPHRDAPVAPRRAVHAEALGRHAQRRRRRVLARGERQPAERLRLPDRRPRPRAGDDLRRPDQERLGALPARGQAARLPQPDRRQRVGGAHPAACRSSDCYVNVLRDAMAVDSLDPCGVYFGTTGGQVYASPDAGDSWTPIVRDLPAVLSVEVQTLP